MEVHKKFEHAFPVNDGSVVLLFSGALPVMYICHINNMSMTGESRKIGSDCGLFLAEIMNSRFRRKEL